MTSKTTDEDLNLLRTISLIAQQQVTPEMQHKIIDLLTNLITDVMELRTLKELKKKSKRQTKKE